MDTIHSASSTDNLLRGEQVELFPGAASVSSGKHNKLCCVCGRSFSTSVWRRKTCDANCSAKNKAALAKIWSKQHRHEYAFGGGTKLGLKTHTKVCDVCGTAFEASNKVVKRCSKVCAVTGRLNRQYKNCRDYRERHPDRIQARVLKYVLKKGYKLTPGDFATMMARQNGRCAICKTDDSGQMRNRRLVVDHCHQTGKVRGLLCFKCNIAIGHLRDDVDLLLAAAAYLQNVSEASP